MTADADAVVAGAPPAPPAPPAPRGPCAIGFRQFVRESRSRQNLRDHSTLVLNHYEGGMVPGVFPQFESPDRDKTSGTTPL